MKKRGTKNPLKLVSPTDGITCPHGGLMPRQKGKATCVPVSAVVWNYAAGSWMEAQAMDARKKESARRGQVAKDAEVAQKLARHALCHRERSGAGSSIWWLSVYFLYV